MYEDLAFTCSIELCSELTSRQGYLYFSVANPLLNKLEI